MAGDTKWHGGTEWQATQSGLVAQSGRRHKVALCPIVARRYKVKSGMVAQKVPHLHSQENTHLSSAARTLLCERKLAEPRRAVAAILAGLAADTIRTTRPSPSAPTPAEGSTSPARSGGTPAGQI